MLENLTYFLNGASLSFFAMGAFHMAIYARQSKSRPHYLFTICLIWMALIELKEFFLSHDAAYNYEILGPGFTFPDLFTLALLSLFFFELVMPGRITARYSLKLLSPFVLLGGAYWLGTAFEPRTVYASLPELLKDLPSFLPTVLLLYTLYTVGYCLFALTRIVLYSIRYSREIAQAYSFTERIHLQWLRWMSALLAFYLLSYIIIILFFSNIWFTILIYILTLTVWGILYGCILQYRIPDIIRDYWQPLPEEAVSYTHLRAHETGRRTHRRKSGNKPRRRKRTRRIAAGTVAGSHRTAQTIPQPRTYDHRLGLRMRH